MIHAAGPPTTKRRLRPRPATAAAGPPLGRFEGQARQRQGRRPEGGGARTPVPLSLMRAPVPRRRPPAADADAAPRPAMISPSTDPSAQLSPARLSSAQRPDQRQQPQHDDQQ